MIANQQLSDTIVLALISSLWNRVMNCVQVCVRRCLLTVTRTSLTFCCKTSIKDGFRRGVNWHCQQVQSLQRNVIVSVWKTANRCSAVQLYTGHPAPRRVHQVKLSKISTRLMWLLVVIRFMYDSTERKLCRSTVCLSNLWYGMCMPSVSEATRAALLCAFACFSVTCLLLKIVTMPALRWSLASESIDDWLLILAVRRRPPLDVNKSTLSERWKPMMVVATLWVTWKQLAVTPDHKTRAAFVCSPTSLQSAAKKRWVLGRAIMY